MKSSRGLFIDMEGFTPSKTDDIFLKNISSKLSSNFKLFIFTDIPKEKQTDMNYIERESPEMFKRASLMLSAHSRELKRNEILEELSKGNNIITINYCYSKIINSLSEKLDINFAKRLFRGMIRPDVVIYHKCQQNLKELFNEYKIIKNYMIDRDNILEKYETEIKELYEITLHNYQNSWSDEYDKNYFPKSIGEDLFIKY